MNGSKARIDNENIKTYKHHCQTNCASNINLTCLTLFSNFLVWFIYHGNSLTLHRSLEKKHSRLDKEK